MSASGTMKLLPRQQRLFEDAKKRELERLAQVAEKSLPSVLDTVPSPVALDATGHENQKLPEPTDIKNSSTEEQPTAEVTGTEERTAEQPPIASYEDWARAFTLPSSESESARWMLDLRSWLISTSVFDPISGEVLPTGLIDFLEAIAERENNDAAKAEDRLSRMAKHSCEAVCTILDHMREKIVREHALIPVHAVREVDSACVRWLSRKPGRNLREKLADHPHIMAVRRLSSLDTSENKLLKACLTRMAETLRIRLNALGEENSTCEELLTRSSRWLNSEEVHSIGPWTNLPPNNVLLQDRYYRKVWDCWLWLQELDEGIARDRASLEQDKRQVFCWELLSALHKNWGLRLYQQPVSINYEHFRIEPEIPLEGMLFAQGETALLPLGFKLVLKENDGAIELTVGGYDTVVHLQGSDLILQDKQRKELLPFGDSGLHHAAVCVAKLLLGPTPPTERSALPKNIRTDCASLDLCSACPEFSCRGSEQKRLPFLLLSQNWPEGRIPNQEMDCGSARALLIDKTRPIVSMRELFSADTDHSELRTSNAARLFAEKLRSFLDVQRLTYLIPDWANDFVLENVRKGMNFAFDHAAPLPRSMAHVFAWQASPVFQSSSIAQGDFILVIDSFDEGFSITPVSAVYRKELKEILPETRGFFWERHPTVEKKLSSNTPLDILKRILEDCRAMSPRTVAKLLGRDGLRSIAGKLSLTDGKGNWIHLGEDAVERLSQDIPSIDLSIDDIKILCGGNAKRIFILAADNLIVNAPSNAKLLTGVSLSPAEGAMSFMLWHDKAPEIDLWRDHLPPLSIQVVRNGRRENFQLVKDVTVTPRRGQAVSIPVQGTFTLPPGKKGWYQFPLQQGDASSQLRFVAFLKSPVFPLKQDVQCRLHMTYTYGADDPYSLVFIPLDPRKAGFQQVKAEWKAEDAQDWSPADMPVPGFPARKTWDELCHYPKKGEETFSNLPDWCLQNIQKVLDYNVNRYKAQYSGTFMGWPKGDVDCHYFFIKSDAADNNVFCQRKDFHDDAERLSYGSTIHFNLAYDSQGRPQAKDAAFSPLPSRDRLIIRMGKDHEYLAESLFRTRFPGLTIWNGRSLEEMPEYFQQAIRELVKKAEEIEGSKIYSQSQRLKDNLFEFLCYLHKDAPAFTVERLLCSAREGKKGGQPEIKIAWAIGAADLPWQQELLNYLLCLDEHDLIQQILKLKALSVALWRSETLFSKLSFEDLKLIHSCLSAVLKKEVDALRKPEPILNKKDENKARFRMEALCAHLELLLATLRSRASSDTRIQHLPDRELTNTYIGLIEQLMEWAAEEHEGPAIRSRLDLALDKPEQYRRTPNLLYALWMYLTGDSGAESIVITGIDES